MMDTSCVADPSSSVAATLLLPLPPPPTATTAELPPPPTSHAQHQNPFISDTTMPSIDQAQESGLNNDNDIHMVVNPLESSSSDAPMPLTAVAVDDASTMPPPPPTVPDAIRAAIGMPSLLLTQAQTQTYATSNGTRSPLPFAQHELLVEEQQHQQAQTSNIPTPKNAPALPTWEESSSAYSISATPDPVVSTPMPTQNENHEQAGVTSTHPISQPPFPSVAAHSEVSPSITSTESGSILIKAPMASLPPPSSSITSTKQMIRRTTPPPTTTNSTTIPSHHYMGPTSATMHLNPPVPSTVQSNPSVEVGGIPQHPAATSTSTTSVGIPQASHPYPMGAPSTMTIMPPSSPPDSMSNPTICSSMASGVAPAPVGSSGEGNINHPLSPKKKCPYPLRRGKWTTEEESYANRLIHEFKSGLLPLTDGTTLRNFLSKLLNCDPMRISKKFVGNNCIGKQVFRRKVPEINRLTPEQVQLMCVELSELERRFFDRVAQTNRVKSSGVATTLAPGATMIGGPTTMNLINVGGKLDTVDMEMKPPTPPWLRPPRTYKPKGKFARKLMMNKAAMNALSRYMPQKPMTDSMPGKRGSGVQSSMTSDGIPRTESALEQLARTASAAKFVEDIVNGEIALGDSEGLGNKLSQSTLQGSFEALMSMDLQSVENLVELAATSNSSAILSELNKNYSESLKYNQSSANLSTRMESFIKSLSNANLFKTGLDSQQALGCLLNASCSNFFDAEKFLKKGESSTAFPRLSGEEGLDNGSHNSVEDFLSLVASGDIPHQDPNMLQVPLQKIMQGSGNGSTAGSKRKLSQQQLVALASRLAPGVNSTSKKGKKK